MDGWTEDVNLDGNRIWEKGEYQIEEIPEDGYALYDEGLISTFETLQLAKDYIDK